MDIVEFLTVLYNSGVGYSSINTARCALSSFLSLGQDKTVGQLPLVKRFLKGVYNKRLSFPRYEQTWNVDVVLKFLRTLSPVNTLSLQSLTWKLVMLLALVTGQRVQTLACLDLTYMKVTDKNVFIQVREILKSSKPGKHLEPINIPAFVDDPRLCVVRVLQEYIRRTDDIRKTRKLLITYTKPYREPSVSTISNWIKVVLLKSGIDISKFKTHSTRSASTTAAFKAGTSVNTILKAAGWKNESVFRKFYNRPVTVQNYDDNFSVRVLRQNSCN